MPSAEGDDVDSDFATNHSAIAKGKDGSRICAPEQDERDSDISSLACHSFGAEWGPLENRGLAEQVRDDGEREMNTIRQIQAEAGFILFALLCLVFCSLRCISVTLSISQWSCTVSARVSLSADSGICILTRPDYSFILLDAKVDNRTTQFISLLFSFPL